MPGFEFVGREEFAEIKDIFDHGGILFRHGFDALRQGRYKCEEFEVAFANRMNVPKALAVSSGSAALRVALAGLNIGPGDEVITQAFTFVATAEAIIEAGAQPVIAEINQTLNLDPQDLEKKITPKTKAVIVVHMLGVPAQMSEILAIAKHYGIAVIEDTAWGCGGSYLGAPLGTLGDIGTYSFDFAKTMTTGEGGMLVFKDLQVAARARAYHDHGHENNPALPRWEDSRSGSGFNYRMSELQGAVGLAQLKKLDDVVKAQREQYDLLASVISQFDDLQMRTVPTGSEITADALVFFTKSSEQALALREALLSVGFGTKILPEAVSWHFAGTWDHMPSLVNKHGNLKTAFPTSKQLLSRAVALPILAKLPEGTDQKVQQALSKVITTCHALI